MKRVRGWAQLRAVDESLFIGGPNKPWSWVKKEGLHAQAPAGSPAEDPESASRPPQLRAEPDKIKGLGHDQGEMNRGLREPKRGKDRRVGMSSPTRLFR